MAKKKFVRVPGAESLLLELLTEELPPKSLKNLSEVFMDQVLNGLIRAQLKLPAPSAVRAFATPRRLAVVIPDVLWAAQDRTEAKKLMPTKVALDENGKPSVALVKRLEKEGLSINIAATDIDRRVEGNIEYAYVNVTIPGAVLPAALTGENGILNEAIKKLPIAKWMRWGDREAQFVRPVHGLIALHGTRVVPCDVLGLRSGNKTLGHRFLSKGAVTIRRAADYEKSLARQGKVVASFEQRRQAIVGELDKAAAKLGQNASWRLGHAQELIDEVTSIVENPRVYVGAFDNAFLGVPRECLIIGMQQHQRYFPVEILDAPPKPPLDVDVQAPTGKLLAQFLFVANMHPSDPSQIIRGNERVLRARLSDATFFYDQDRRLRLEERVPRLAHVVYHNKLGSQLERVQRIEKLAVAIARRLNAAVELVREAAHLSKADLVTEMVGEFPELQGIMGRYYAEAEGKAECGSIIEQHYWPRYAGDVLPLSAESISVALADKLDTLLGIYGVGLVPTGDKDPFGLRRLALGVVRILVERAGMLPPLDIQELLQLARENLRDKGIAEKAVQDLYGFVLERLRYYLRERGYAPDEIDAVLALNPTRLNHVIPRLDALQRFRALPEGMALAAANKRIRNILRQAGGGADGTVDPALFAHEAEKRLEQAMTSAARDVTPLIGSGDYAAALTRLASLRPVVDEFFDKVMVMADDTAVKANRLTLLNNLSALFLHIADVSRLQG